MRRQYPNSEKILADLANICSDPRKGTRDLNYNIRIRQHCAIETDKI